MILGVQILKQPKMDRWMVAWLSSPWKIQGYHCTMFFSRMRSKGSGFTLGVSGLSCVRQTLPNRPQPSATVCSRSQPSAWGPYGRAFGKFQRRVASFRVAGVVTSWHSNMFHDVSKIVFGGRCNTFATFLEDGLHFSWQAQHCGHLRCHFAWQVRHFRRVVLRVFCESDCQHCVKWSQGANSVAGVAFYDMSWKWTEASHETSILRSVRKKTRRKTSILKLGSVKCKEVSHEMLLWCSNMSRFKTGCNVVLCGRRGTLWHSNMFHDVSKAVLCGRRKNLATFSEDALHFWWQAQHFEDLRCHFAWQARHFRRVVSRISCESQSQG